MAPDAPKPRVTFNSFYTLFMLFGFAVLCFGIPVLFFELDWKIALVQMAVILPIIVFVFMRFNRFLNTVMNGLLNTLGLLNDEFSIILPQKKSYMTPDYIDELLIHTHRMIKKQVDLKTRYHSALDEIKYHERLREAIFDISTIMLAGPDEEVFEHTIEKALSIISCAKSGSVALLDPQTRELYFVASKNYKKEILQTIRFKLEDSYFYQLTDGKLSSPAIIDNLDDYNKMRLPADTTTKIKEAGHFTIQSSIGAPLFKDSSFIGVLFLDSDEPHAYSEADKDLIGFFASITGMTLKYRDLMEETIYLSRHDKLTGIYNRRYFEESFNRFQEQSFGGNLKFTLVIMDLNYLKSINDTFGHVYGDGALRLFVDTIKPYLSSADIFARYGGDEFIIIFSGDSLESSQQKMVRIQESFKSLCLDYMSRRIPVQFSYGLAFCPEESMIMDILVKIADNRMYQHKKQQKMQNLNDPNFRVFTQNQHEIVTSDWIPSEIDSQIND